MWYTKVSKDISVLPDFIAHYSTELDAAKKDVGIYGNLEKSLSQLPGITEYRFGQLQEIEAVLNLLNIKSRQLRKAYFKKYLETYNRALTSRDAEKYVDGEDDVIDMDLLINEVALLRNKWMGIIKGLESKGFQVSAIVRLRVAGLEDITL